MATDYGFDVFRHFVDPGLKLGKPVLSPLREERIPSFSVYTHSHGSRRDIWYKDFSETGSNYHGDCFQFVQALFGLTSLHESIKEIKQRVLGVYDDNPVQMKAVIRKKYTPKKIVVEKPVELIPTYRFWKQSDLRFFNRFMIDQRGLRDFHVYPAKSYTMIKNEKVIEISERSDDPIYVIIFPSGRMKIYRPMTSNKRFKWVSNIKADEDVFGFDLLPSQCKNLFLLAGNKDTMSFVSTTGIPAIALSSESALLPAKVSFLIESIAERIHILYDNDGPGIKSAINLSAMTGYKTHGHLLQKIGPSISSINDYSQLIDEYPESLEYFFTLLKSSMNKTKKLTFQY